MLVFDLSTAIATDGEKDNSLHLNNELYTQIALNRYNSHGM